MKQILRLGRKLLRARRLKLRRMTSINLASNNSNRNVLSKSQEKEIKDYYKPFIKTSTVFHNYYTEKTGQYFKEYIPEDIYFCYIDPYFNDVNAAKYLDNKCLYHMFFPGVEMPECVLRRMNGYWYIGTETRIASKDEVNAALAAQNEVFVKIANDSYGGKGVRYLCGDSDELVSSFWKCIDAWSGDIIVQKPVVQHRELAALNASSVNTIRVFSLLRGEETVFFSTILRMGVKGAKVDNASSGGITCGIDENGRLKKYGYYAYSGRGERRTEHPTSGCVFESVTIPNFDKVIALVKRLHPSLPHFRMVSWDIAISAEGEPVLIEVNLCRGEIDFHQLNNGPLFGKDTDSILKGVFQKKR